MISFGYQWELIGGTLGFVINTRHLRYFVAVAEELHFGRAAARLHMAQPPLSQQIRQLEADLGLQLFVRTTRRVTVTEAGELLLGSARAVLDAAASFERRAQELGSGDVGVLRLGLVDSSSYETMPKFLQRYRSLWPGIEPQLRSLSSDEQIQALAAGEIDVGLARTSGRQLSLQAIPLVVEPMVLAVDSEHPLAENGRVALSSVVAETFIGFDRNVSPTLHRELVALFAGSGVVYDPVIEATEYATILSLVASGQGIAIVPASVQSLRPPTLRYLRVEDPAASTTLYLLTRPNPVSVAVQRAISLAQDLFTPNASEIP